jgi:putative DNA methylase
MKDLNQECPRLIEVFMPIAETSAESVRDKSLRHGHISTMHLWWARRPLAASRAIVFESLVYDPDNPQCPPVFRDKVKELLQDHINPALRYYTRKNHKVAGNPEAQDPYHPYDGVPDTLRNRLLMFVAKWSPETVAFRKGDAAKPPSPSETLDDRCLVRWETSDPTNEQGREILHIAKELILAAHGGTVPTVLDPFAGGGAIPLEAGRLGCTPIANDYNPVAYLILRATCEYPQRYGKPGMAMQVDSEASLHAVGKVKVDNVLASDFEYWTNHILGHVQAKIGRLYPAGSDGRTIVAYIWARTAPCSNPSCRGTIPLLRTLMLCDTPTKKRALVIHADKSSKTCSFSTASGSAVKEKDGTMLSRGNVQCPYCGQTTTVEQLHVDGCAGHMGEQMVAVVVDTPGGKEYRPVEPSDLAAVHAAGKQSVPHPAEPIEHGQWNIKTWLYGMDTWGSLFSQRQLVSMQTFVEEARRVIQEMETVYQDSDYRLGLATYLGLWVSRVAQRGSNVGLWNTKREEMEHPFGRQAIPMTWDYPEGNPFSGSTGGAQGNTGWMLRVIRHESNSHPASLVLLGDAARLDTRDCSVDSVVTDPPYFDAISYADLSDYFYIWLKRVLADEMPNVFATPLTPKTEEATALKHRFGGDSGKANAHFREKLADGLRTARQSLVDGGVVSVMFAHQSTEAWTALIEAIFDAGLTVTATWPIDTELTTALKGTKSVLGSSVTVVCRKRSASSLGDFRTVKTEIAASVHNAIKRFWDLGVRGADLLVSCYGPAVGVFGKYERVERGDGSIVNPGELLELAREAAMDAIAGDFHADAVSKIYYTWANLFGTAEQDYDQARLLAQVGGEAESALEMAHSRGILVIDGQHARLALLADRAKRRRLGEDVDAPLVDRLHRSLLLWKSEKADELAQYLRDNGLLEDDAFWRLAQSLFQTLPHETDDWKLVRQLINERTTLSKRQTTERKEELF